MCETGRPGGASRSSIAPRFRAAPRRRPGAAHRCIRARERARMAGVRGAAARLPPAAEERAHHPAQEGRPDLGDLALALELGPVGLGGRLRLALRLLASRSLRLALHARHLALHLAGLRRGSGRRAIGARRVGRARALSRGGGLGGGLRGRLRRGGLGRQQTGGDDLVGALRGRSSRRTSLQSVPLRRSAPGTVRRRAPPSASRAARDASRRAASARPSGTAR